MKNYKSISIGIIICLFCSGCSHSTPKSITVQAEGILEQQESGMFSGSYAVKISEEQHMAIEINTPENIDEMLGKAVVVKGVWNEENMERQNIVKVIDIRLLSYDWTPIFSKTLQGSVSLPIFINAKETADGMMWIQNQEVIAIAKPYTKPSESILLTPIKLNKKEALRYEEGDALHILIPDDGISVMVMDKSGDLSLLYSIIETYSKTNAIPNVQNMLIAPSNTEVRQYNWFASFIKNIHQYVDDEETVSRISFSKTLVDIEYHQEKTSEQKRIILSLPDKKIIAKYTMKENTKEVWEKTEGNLPKNNSLFSFSTLKSQNIITLDENFIWLFSDLLAIQIAYPEKMYYSEDDTGITFLFGFGPFRENDPQAKSFIRLEKKDFMISASSDIDPLVLDKMKKSITAY